MQSYRGFRQEWHATPKTQPRLVIDQDAGGRRAGFVSWNGATDVSDWVVFEGPAQDRLSRVGRIRYRGFETEFVVNQSYVQVAAVVHGKIGKKSNVAFKDN